MLAVLSPALARGQFVKTIQVDPGVPVVAVTTWYINNCKSLGTGGYSFLQEPKHGIVDFAGAIAPLPAGTCNSISLPADIAYYTWTDSDPAFTSDYFQMKYSNGGASEVLNISVVLNPTPTMKITKHPVIFIPGVAGSYLNIIDPANAANNQELWPGGLLTNHFLLSLYPEDNPSTSIQAPDVIRDVEVAGIDVMDIYSPVYSLLTDLGYREYHLNGDPSRTACDTSQNTGDPSTNPNLFSFPYDWRKDIAITSQELASYIDCVQQFYPGATVDILSHSMGGLVARRYILDYGGSNVNALITMAAPWLGATKFVNVLQTGDFGVSQLLVFDSTIKYLVGSFAGAHELLPSQGFFDLGGLPMLENGWDFNSNGINFETYQPLPFQNAIDLNYAHSSCPGSFCPGDTGFGFHSYTNNGNEQDNWSNDSTGVQYFHIVGYQSGPDNTATPNTIEQVAASTWTVCGNSKPLLCSSKNYFDLTMNEGDGTVPFLSASREGNSLDYNTSDSTRQYVAIGTDDHTSLVGNASVQNAVMQFLNEADQNAAAADVGVSTEKGRRSSVKSLRPIKPAASTPVNAPGSFVTVGHPYHFLKINGADGLTVMDSLGNSTGPIAGTTSLYGGVPGVQQYIIGPHIWFATIPLEGSFTVQFTTSEGTLAIELTTGTNTTVTQAVRYIDVPVVAGKSARLTIGPSSIGSLQIDSDGSGKFAAVVTPTATLMGSSANDVTAPTITFSLSPAAPLTMTIAAKDAGSGLKDVLYSLDGETYTPYLNPFVVDPSATPRIYAFADDNAGNRASASYTVSKVALALNPGGVVNAASYASDGLVSPGSIASVFGSGLSADGGTFSLQVNNIGSYLFGVYPQQANFQIPWELAGLSQGTLIGGGTGAVSSPISLGIAAFSPGIFTVNGSGTGQGAITDALSGRLAAATGALAGVNSQPVSPGGYIAIYCTGLGPVTNQPADGIASPAVPLAETITHPTVTIGGLPATVTFSGLAPGLIGLYQVNTQVPQGITTSNNVPVVISIGQATSNTVTIAVE